MDSQSATRASDAIFHTGRVLHHSPQIVFDAFAQAERLERWWGPAGFTNTFEVFEFTPGGRWKYMMYGPNGAQFANESRFVELEPPARIVIQHLSKPHYVLTITLRPHDEGTAIDWRQEFADAGVAARIRHIVEPSNEQNLDRLEALLAEARAQAI